MAGWGHSWLGTKTVPSGRNSIRGLGCTPVDDPERKAEDYSAENGETVGSRGASGRAGKSRNGGKQLIFPPGSTGFCEDDPSWATARKETYWWGSHGLKEGTHRHFYGRKILRTGCGLGQHAEAMPKMAIIGGMGLFGRPPFDLHRPFYPGYRYTQVNLPACRADVMGVQLYIRAKISLYGYKTAPREVFTVLFSGKRDSIRWQGRAARISLYHGQITVQNKLTADLLKAHRRPAGGTGYPGITELSYTEGAFTDTRCWRPQQYDLRAGHFLQQTRFRLLHRGWVRAHALQTMAAATRGWTKARNNCRMGLWLLHIRRVLRTRARRL